MLINANVCKLIIYQIDIYVNLTLGWLFYIEDKIYYDRQDIPLKLTKLKLKKIIKIT
jgi:hypothetical protein